MIVCGRQWLVTACPFPREREWRTSVPAMEPWGSCCRPGAAGDPFPPEDCPERIIKRDGVDFLRAQPDQSLDLVISTFAVHFMDRPSLDKELARVLRPSGRAIWF
ncbi:unnamed protein product, partial [Durusdinium trenchii]